MRVSDSPAAVFHKSQIIGSDICLLHIRLFGLYQGLHANTLFPNPPPPRCEYTPVWWRPGTCCNIQGQWMRPDGGFILCLAPSTLHSDMLRGKNKNQNDLFSRAQIEQLANNLNKGLVMCSLWAAGELHRQGIKIWQADDGWGSWVAAHAYKQNIMIVCYDNTVNGQKLADVDCLDAVCTPRGTGTRPGWMVCLGGGLGARGHSKLL